MAKKEFKVGEVFQMGLVELKCQESTIKECYQCKDCYFFNQVLKCNELFDMIGYCDHRKREDKTDVIFVKVEE